MEFPAHFYSHPLKTADAGRVVELVNAHARFIDSTEEQESVDSILSTWALPDFDLDRDALLLVDNRNSSDAAYADLVDIKHPYVRKYAYAKLHPDYSNDKVGGLHCRERLK